MLAVRACPGLHSARQPVSCMCWGALAAALPAAGNALACASNPQEDVQAAGGLRMVWAARGEADTAWRVVPSGERGREACAVLDAGKL